MKTERTPRLLLVACALTLLALGLICFGILHPSPLAVIFAMSVGQGIGTIGAVLFAIVVLRDLRPRFRDRTSVPPPSKAPAAEPPASEPAAAEPPASDAPGSGPVSEKSEPQE